RLRQVPRNTRAFLSGRRGRLSRAEGNHRALPAGRTLWSQAHLRTAIGTSTLGGSMSGTSAAAELYSTIAESARLLNVACSRDKVWPILSAYADAFTHPDVVVAFRVATALRHVGELDCRFRTHPDDRDPYAVALSNGLTTETDHPIGALLPDVQG